MKAFTITKNDAGQRVDKFLIKILPAMPKSLVYKSLRKKRIRVNGKHVKENMMLREGDLLEAYINDEFFQQKPEQEEFMQLASVSLDIVYEDENLLIVNKPQGLSVHADESATPDTLINRIRRYLFDKGEYDPQKEQTFAPALAHRLDRNTAGLVIAAKNAESLRILCEKIRDREIKKYYLCITKGHLEKESATLRAYHRKDEKQKLAQIFDRPVLGTKEMITKYRVIKRYRIHDLTEINLITGRTHQIRAHMAHIGHPLLGDGKYGQLGKNPLLAKQALLAYRLHFAFTTDSGILSYLQGKEVAVSHPQLVPSELEDRL